MAFNVILLTLGKMLVKKGTYVKINAKSLKKHQLPSISAFAAVCCYRARSCNESYMSFAFPIDRARSW